ncbi:hypothetical protein J31TS4_02210 [Paenibacillus sp. J31TS4]|uniref:hypothetical protein n=1 Tax=Paenibacillus sp. J31TS4 TaxID=2807195 RepID=UPI001B01B4B6|nr:hypothetical protein [Paenibacillus sp. J31TS4]GIP36941.1 hypothetical protein J31TS4_02210 [Paenibacillus sp. J31TS4]
MGKLLAAFRLECRHLFSSWLLLPLPVLLGLWMASSLSSMSPAQSQDLYLYTMDFQRIQFTLSLAVPFLVGVTSVRRDLDRPSYEWLGGLPVSSGTLLTAKLAAGMVYLSLFPAAMALVYGWFGVRSGLPADVLRGELLWFAVQHETAYLVTLVLALLLAVAIRNRVVYLIAFCGWVFGTFFLSEFVVTRLSWYALKPFLLHQMIQDGMPATEAWSIKAGRGELKRILGFQLAAAALLLAAAGAVLHKRRPSLALPAWRLATGALALIAVLAYWPYGSQLHERQQRLAVKAQEAGLDRGGEEAPDGRFPVDKASLAVRWDNEAGAVRLEAALTVRRDRLPAGKVPFTLNPAFPVDEVLVNGRPAPFHRGGQTVTIAEEALRADGKEATITFRYKAPDYDWMPSPLEEGYAAIATKEALYLPAASGWYPHPGRQPMYEGGDRLFPVRLRYNALTFGDASWEVRTDGFGTEVFATLEEAGGGPDKVFQSGRADGVSLYAGTLIRSGKSGELPIVTTPGNRREAEAFGDKLQQIRAYYDSWLPVREGNGIRQIVYLQAPSGSGTRGSNTVEGRSLFIPQTKSHNLDNFQLLAAQKAYLFGDADQHTFSYSGMPAEDFSVVSEIRYLLLYLYYREGKGMSEQEVLRDVPYFAGALGDSSRGEDRAYGKEMRQLVEKAIRGGKLPEVKKLLAGFYREGLTVRQLPDEGLEYPRIPYERWLEEWDKQMGGR